MDEDVAEALAAAAADGSWGRYHGPHLERLVALLCEMHQVPFAYPCCSGTYATELALRGLNIGERDEVILAGYDFPGNFRCIEAVGARPVLVDIDYRSGCLDVERIAEAIGPLTRALIVSHLHSGLADMANLVEITRHRGLAMIEDACQAPGALVRGRLAGTWGDVGTLSFGGSKLLTAGRGGALLTQREDVLQRVRIFSERGNEAFPMSELQAAVLPPQLSKLGERNQRRQISIQRLLSRLGRCEALHAVDTGQSDCAPSYYKFAWRYRAEACSARTRAEFLAAIQAEGVAMDAGFRGFVRRGPRRCRQASSLDLCRTASEATVLLHHPVLLEPPETMDVVADAIRKVVRCWQDG